MKGLEVHNLMTSRRLLLIFGLVVAVPVSGQPTNPNRIGPGSVPATIYDAVEPAKQRQIIDECPHIRDFREAPVVPGSMNSVFGKTGNSGSSNVRRGDKSAKDLLNAKRYTDAQLMFEKLLQSDKTAENYAGLAESLAMQNKVHEAEVVLREARANNFSNDASVEAVTGHVMYMHASDVSYTKYNLYLEASVTLCKRALAVDPQNQIALTTLKNVRSMRLEKAKEFEENGDLLLAQFEYEELLKEKNDDDDANSALVKLKLEMDRFKLLSKTLGRQVSLFDGKFREIPARTKVEIAFDTPLNSDTSKPGDKFSARTLEPIADKDGYVVLPVGATIRGTVSQPTESTSEQHMSDKGMVQLRFDSIEASGIDPMLLVARLVTRDGIIHGTRNNQNISYDTSVDYPRFLSTLFLGKKGKAVDVRVGDQFSLEFSDGLRVFRER